LNEIEAVRPPPKKKKEENLLVVVIGVVKKETVSEFFRAVAAEKIQKTV
jgi:hypothetical protein